MDLLIAVYIKLTIYNVHEYGMSPTQLDGAEYLRAKYSWAKTISLFHYSEFRGSKNGPILVRRL